MFKAILYDLDGTLLNIEMDYFLKQYFGKMMSMAAQQGYENVQQLVEQVFYSTGVMIADRNPQTTNEEVFMQDFLKDGSMFGNEAEAQAFFDEFYQVGFPQLQKFCQPFPGIPEMMARVLARPVKVVIATNAVFPLKALQDRMDWAGVGHFDYDLITSYEIMHACKPHPEYYLEIAEHIGVKPEECLMIGNDMGEDLVAGTVGMKTFLVEDMLIARDVDYKPDWHGRLVDLLAFMKELG